jgi:hypothetical protein
MARLITSCTALTIIDDGSGFAWIAVQMGAMHRFNRLRNLEMASVRGLSDEVDLWSSS